MTYYPVAIIGFAFRFPGDINDEEGFWKALKQQCDLVTEVPADRWATGELQHKKRSEPGRSISFSAGVLSRIDEFDAQFFGISPREAAWLDPQQRLLLELSWEAMENAGVLPSRLAGTDCAVYVGISSLDYGTRGLDDLASMSAHSMTGNTLSIAANRLSYAFDLHGPSLAVDTACSSSLVALHHACLALQTGAASTALVGGVSLLLHPYPFVGFTKASMLSEDGRCKVFDAAGNGYVRAEGGAVMLLKPLDKAIADGDPIQAVILGSGVNADGARKTGITIPSPEGQAELMRTVLAKTGLKPGDVDFIEAHGTGTAVGDPIECAAIGEVYGQGRDAPLPIGSVKANLGHMEAASGMAGLVKTILALKNRALPAQIHLRTPNPHIDFPRLGLRPVTEYLEFDKPTLLVAGLNSFGFGGANAHVLLQEYRAEITESRALPAVLPPLFLSAKTDAALRALSARYAGLIDGEVAKEAFYDIAHGAAYRRDRLQKRLAAWAETLSELIQNLTTFAQGQDAASIVVEDALPEPGGIAFIYSGNGAQWIGMGRRLLAESARFQELLLDLNARMQPLAGFSLLEELAAEEGAAHLDDTTVAQPLLFAMQVALTQLLREQGLVPDAVAGHSVGEVAAAWAAGALDIDAAIRVIVARSRAQGLTRGTGRMAAVGLSAQAAQSVLIELGESDVVIAGFNSPNNVTLSGSLFGLQRIEARLAQQGVFFRLLDLDYAFHSDRMDPVRDVLLESLAGLAPSEKAAAAFVSTVTGERLGGDALTADYWWRNVREPVRFAQAIEGLARLGCRIFVEIGPHAILQRYIGESLSAAGVKGGVLPTLRKGQDGWQALFGAILRAHLLGAKSHWDAFFPVPGRYVRLPNYPWQRERFWHPRTSESLMAIERRRVHPLLGWKIPEAEGVWENVLDPEIVSWLADHKVGGAIVFPGAAYVEMALAAAREWLGGDGFACEEFDIVSPMVFDGEHARSLRFELHTRDGSFTIRSRQRLSQDEWTLHAAGRILQPVRLAGMPAIQPPSHPATICGDELYHWASSLGLEYGPSFQGVAELQVGANLLEGRLVDEHPAADADYLIHPAWLDACYQSLVGFFRESIESGKGTALLPVKFARVERYGTGIPRGFRTRLVRRSARSVLADFELYDAQGNLLSRLTGCRFRAAPLVAGGQNAPSHWQIVPWLRPHPADGRVAELPPPERLLEVLHESSSPVRRAWFKEALPLIEALVVAFAHEAVRIIAARAENVLDQLAASGDSYVRWLMGLLREEKLLTEQDGHWMLEEESGLPPAEEIWRTILRDHPAALPQLVLLGRVGRHLADLLLDASARPGFLSGLLRAPVQETLYDDDPTYQGMRTAIEHILAELAAQTPPHRRLRVLEISTGESDLARGVLVRLSEERLDYVLAVPEGGIEHQQAKYSRFANLIVARFDWNNDELTADKPVPEHFDLVIVRHALHQARSPLAALGRLRQRLAAAGYLLIAERYADYSADFLYGLDKAWWHASTTDAAPLSSLVPPTVWREALAEQGFADIHTFEEPAAEGLAEGVYLLLARRPMDEAVLLPASQPASWILLCDAASAELARHLETRLIALDQRVRTLGAPPEDWQDVQHVVDMRGWNDAPDAASSRLAAAHAMVQACAAQPRPPRLWWLTSGGALCSSYPGQIALNPAQSALWGFVRVVMNELPMLSSTVLDLADDLAPDQWAMRLENELLRPDGANEVILTATGRYVPRLRERDRSQETPATEGERYRLDFHLPGKLSNLRWLPMDARPLAEGEVEVEVVATGLNFRDVMYLMGLLPDEAVENGFAGASLGLEFSGVVSRVGPRVREFRPGDRVMGFASACFATHVVTRADAVAPIPPEWPFEAAATVPTVFLTAYYALRHLANLEAGEPVLIHGAAGGVGIAAIQIAKHFGAEVFAAAGSPEKRDFVGLLGADHVFDSRTLAFADEILAATNGQGVDIVLNSLAGEAMRRSLAVLKPFGRFLELGKRDFYENTPIGLRPLRENISYFGIDADQLLIGRPELAARLFREVMALFREGALAPLPCRVFPAERVVEAFRTMQQSRHIGKIVVSLAGARPMIERPVQEAPALRLDKESTWLVSGGLSGFGLESARWLAARGVGHLVLIGRRGPDTPGAREAIDVLSEQGVKVLAVACDITDAQSVEDLVSQVRATLPPIKGVLHAAATFDDALLQNLDADRLEAVIAPKLKGAWNLHQATLDIPLEYFVLYSSITTAIGNPGQANYVAANAGLEGLAAYRRALGLPATCIGWGPIGDAGYLTRNEAVRNSLAQRLGRAPLTAQEALSQLDRLLNESDGLAVANFDWNVLARLLPSAASERFASLNRGLNNTAMPEGEADFHTRIVGKSPEEILAIVRQLVAQEVAQVLAISADRIDPTRSLHDLGLDSLMAVELALALEQRIGLQLPVMMLNQSPTVEKVSQRVVERLLRDEDGSDSNLVQELARQHGESVAVEDLHKIAEDARMLARQGAKLTA